MSCVEVFSADIASFEYTLILQILTVNILMIVIVNSCLYVQIVSVELVEMMHFELCVGYD